MSNDNNDKQTTFVLGGGGVEYSMEEAMVDIEELIAALEEAVEDGATHVVMLSGNYRGAQWSSVTASVEPLDDEE